MTVYNLMKLPNKTLLRMLKIHEYLLMKSKYSNFVGHDELYQFFAYKNKGCSNFAQVIERTGIAYIDLHPTKKASGQPKALFFQDTGLIEQAIQEINHEIDIREGKVPRGSRYITVAPVRIGNYQTASEKETIANLDSMLNMFAPKRRNENVRSE